jgi:hypothetical protein
MIKEMILKADYRPVTQIDGQRAKLMFKTEDVKKPIYKTDEYDEHGFPIVDHYEDTDYCNALVEYYKGERTEAAMRKLIEDWYNPEIDAKILNGFVWNEKPVYLSDENQRNFSEGQRMAEKDPSILPITYKLGQYSDGSPAYHTFTTFEELDVFYKQAFGFINQCLSEGWQKKDGFDWSLYVDTPSSDS